MAETLKFKFALEGKGVRPGNVPIADLVDLLKHLEKALQATARAEEGGGVDTSISLTQITESSVEATIEASPKMVKAAEIISDAIRRKDYSRLGQGVRNEVRAMQTVLGRNPRYTSVRFWENGASLRQVRITKDDVIPQPRKNRGPTTLYGVCERVNGKSLTASIRTNLKTLTIRLATAKLAVELGQRLLQKVGLEGSAIWDYDSGELLEFTATELNGYAGGMTNRQRLDALAEGTAHWWDGIDPDDFTRSLRDE